jgi:hypothetical protein
MDDREEILAMEFAWADKLGQEIDAAEKAAHLAVELQLHRARVIAAKTPEFWEGIKFAAQHAVPRLGSRYTFTPKGADSFVVAKSNSPARVVATLNSAGASISISYILEAGQDEPRELSDRLDIRVDGHDNLHLIHQGERATPYAALDKLFRAAFLPR